MKLYKLSVPQEQAIKKAVQKKGLIYHSELRQDTADVLRSNGLIELSSERRRPYVTDYVLTVRGWETARALGLLAKEVN